MELLLKYSCRSQRQLLKFGQIGVCYTMKIAFDLCTRTDCMYILIQIVKPQEVEGQRCHKVTCEARSFSCGWRVAFRVLHQKFDSDRTPQGLDGAP